MSEAKNEKGRKAAMKSIVKVLPFALILCFVTNVAAQIDEEAVMGCWLFEDEKGDTAEDSSIYARDVTLTGGPKWVDGKYGGGLELQGGQGTVPGTEETLQLTSYTLLAWVQPENTGGFQGIMHKEEGGVSGRTFLMYLGTDGVPRCSMSQGGTNKDFGGNTLVTDGEWHHIAVTFDEDSRMAQVYVDGVLEGSNAYPEDVPQHNTIAKLNKPNYRGVIDEMLIANVVMDEEDIQNAMEGLAEFIGGTAVEPSGKVASVWGVIKTIR